MSRALHEDRHHDPFKAANEYDPNLMLVQPPEPYSLVLPGIPIIAGDLKRPTGPDANWVPVEDSDIGHKAPGSGLAFARVVAPEGYTIAPDDSRVELSDMLWLSNEGEWLDIRNWRSYDDLVNSPPESRITVMLLRAWYKEQNILLFVARPNPTTEIRVREVPARHRRLYPNEKVRAGDKVLYEGITEWTPVAAAACDCAVPHPDSSNGFARYARPVGPEWTTWWVTADGVEGADGSWEKPFKQQDAVQQVQAMCWESNKKPHGIIMTKEGGVPLMSFDLGSSDPVVSGDVSSEKAKDDDEMEVVRVQPALPPVTAETASSEPLVAPIIEEIPAPLEHPSDALDAVVAEHVSVEPEPEPEPKYTAKWINTRWPKTKKHLYSQAGTTLNPKYRLMAQGEESKPGDLIYMPLDDDDADTLTWQNVPAELLGVDPGLTGHIMARKIAPKTKPDIEKIRAKVLPLRDMLDQLQVQVVAILELCRNLEEQ